MASKLFAKKQKYGDHRLDDVRLEEMEELMQEEGDSGSGDEKDDEPEDVIYDKVSHPRKRLHHKTVCRADDVKRSVIQSWERRGKSPPWFVYLPWNAISLTLVYVTLITWISLFTYCILEITIWNEDCNPSSKEMAWWRKSPILSVDFHPSENQNLLPNILYDLTSFHIHTIRLVSPDWWDSLEDDETQSVLADIISKCHERGIYVIMDIDLDASTQLNATDIQNANQTKVLCEFQGYTDIVGNYSLTVTDLVMNLFHQGLNGLYIRKNCLQDEVMSDWTSNFTELWQLEKSNTSSEIVVAGEIPVKGVDLVTLELSAQSVSSASVLLENITSHLEMLDGGGIPLWEIERAGFHGDKGAEFLQRLILLQVFLPGVTTLLPSDLRSSPEDIIGSDELLRRALHLRSKSDALQEGEIREINQKIKSIGSNVFAVLHISKHERHLISWNLNHTNVTIDFSFLSISGEWVFSTNVKKQLEKEVLLGTCDMGGFEFGLIKLPQF